MLCHQLLAQVLEGNAGSLGGSILQNLAHEQGEVDRWEIPTASLRLIGFPLEGIHLQITFLEQPDFGHAIGGIICGDGVGADINFNDQIGRWVHLPINAVFADGGLPVVDVEAIVGFNATDFGNVHRDRGKGFVVTIFAIQEDFYNSGEKMGFASVAGQGTHQQDFSITKLDVGNGAIPSAIAQGAVVLPGSGHSQHATGRKVDFFTGDNGVHRAT